MGSDPVLFQHLFWYFGHPEVYVMILPGFGMISTLLGKANGCLFGGLHLVIAMLTIAVVGMLVWGHHMFTVGMDVDSRGMFGVGSVLIGVPTGGKVC